MRLRVFSYALRGAFALGAIAAAASFAIPACSLGEGNGSVSGTLNIPDCWTGGFDLKPDFFAAIPYRSSSMILRIQNGGDYETFSDGVTILVDDIAIVRGLISGAQNADGGAQPSPQLKVALPPEVTPPGVPITPNPNPALVHFALYLMRSCRVQNDALYAVDRVRLGPDGGCGDDPADDGGVSLAQSCNATGVLAEGGADGGADAAPPPPAAPVSVGQSWIRFDALSTGDDQSEAKDRLNSGEFDVYLADPREVCPGGPDQPGALPPKCRGHVHGKFSFFYQRGRPAQPFP